MTSFDHSPEGAVGMTRLMRILRLRSRWIVLGTILGFVASVAYVLAMPQTYTSTAFVNISPVGAAAATDVKSASSLVDLPTERQLAVSSLTAQGAASKLGDGWTESRLRKGAKATAEAESTIVRVSFTDQDKQAAADAANEMANSYLTVRTELVQERKQRTVDAIDQSIRQLEQELADMQDPYSDTEYDATRVASIRESITKQEQRKSSMNDVAPMAGEVITPASVAAATAQPDRIRTVALGLLAGLVLGIVLALIRHAFARTPLEAHDLEPVFDAPVWRPSGQIDDPLRWSLATEIARHHAEDRRPALLVDTANADARSAGEMLSKELGSPVIDLGEHRACTIESLDTEAQVIVVIPVGWTNAACEQLAGDLGSIGATVVGVVVSDVDREGVASRV